MKTKLHLHLLKPALVIASMALPLLSQAQQPSAKPHPRYKLIDLGTFGGPSSTVEFLIKSVNNRGMVVGASDTAIPDPFAPNCFSPSCFIQHAFQWQGGV